MIGLEEAQRQAATLLQASEDSPVRQYRYELRRRGVEWQRAAKELEGNEEQAAIELVGSVGPGMKVPLSRAMGVVIRQMSRDGQLSLHVEDEDGRPVYLNFVGSSSPCVVQA